jgi:hypothetical protein
LLGFATFVANLGHLYVRPDFLRELPSMSAPAPPVKRIRDEAAAKAPERQECELTALKRPRPAEAPAAEAPAAEAPAAEAPAAEAPSPEEREELDAAVGVLNDMFRVHNPLSNHLQNPVVSYPLLARPGGAVRNSFVSATKKLIVKLDADGIALWKLKHSNLTLVRNLQSLLNHFAIEGKKGEKVHPVLGFSNAELPEEQRNKIAKLLYPESKAPKRRFAQFLCYLGMRSRTSSPEYGPGTDRKSRTVIWRFDPEAWNRLGYRLVSSGDTKGGKPRIEFVV